MSVNKQGGAVPAKELPGDIPNLVNDLNSFRNNPAAISGALEQLDRLSIIDLWGNRADDERDINRAPSVRSNIDDRLNIPKDCANGIKRILKRMQAEMQKFEEEVAWRNRFGNQPQSPTAVWRNYSAYAFERRAEDSRRGTAEIAAG